MPYTNLVETARAEGMQKILIAALIRNGEQLLLIKRDQIYEFPTAELKSGETIQQALQRGIIENTNLRLENVISFLNHFDENGVRQINFIATVLDPFSIQLRDHSAYAWVDLQETYGYPITDHLRETLDVFAKQI